MIKKALLSLLTLLVLTASIIYVNKFHVIRYLFDLPKYTHDFGIERELMLPMRDGVKLYTRYFLPKNSNQMETDEQWPIVLIRYPYEKTGEVIPYICRMFNGYGYGCVSQLVRGLGASEGLWEPVVSEHNDGTDALNWIAEQSWMDGNIGMWGSSYLSYTQWAAAHDYPKELKTFVPSLMGTNFQKVLYEKGAFRHFVSAWAMSNVGREGKFAKKEESYFEALKKRPHIEMDESYLGFRVDWYRGWVSAPSPLSGIWFREDGRRLAQVTANLDIPVLMIEGLYDPFFGSMYDDYLSLATKNQSKIIFGPWTHGGMASGKASDLIFGNILRRSLQETLVWFDHHLKGVALKEKYNAFQIYDMGTDSWHAHDVWPPKVETASFNLSSFSQANTCEGGRLVLDGNKAPSTPSATPLAESITYVYDPENPVLTRGGAAFIMPVDENMTGGSFAQEAFCERDDVLTFMTDPLEKELTIAGEIKILLNVSSEAEDTTFTAKIMDVHPDGRALNIRDSATTLLYRNDVNEPLIYEPGTVVDVQMDMWATQWTLKPSHRLRIDISSSNFPAFTIHSNFAGPWAEQVETKKAMQTLYSPSVIELPVLDLVGH